MNQEITGSEIVLKSLKDQGVEVVFGYPGGAVLPIYDSFFKQNLALKPLTRPFSSPGAALRVPRGVAPVGRGPGLEPLVFFCDQRFYEPRPLCQDRRQILLILGR